MFYTCTEPKSILGTENCKTRIYPKATDNNHLHTMLPKQEEILFCIILVYSKAHYILAMPPFLSPTKSCFDFIELLALEHQQEVAVVYYILK
jgi:hypothetical protein